MRKFIRLLSNPIAMLLIVMSLLTYQQLQVKFISLDLEKPKKVDSVLVGTKTPNVWQEWCFYTFNDGSVTKKYEGSVNATSPNYTTLDKNYTAECH